MPSARMVEDVSELGKRFVQENRIVDFAGTHEQAIKARIAKLYIKIQKGGYFYRHIARGGLLLLGYVAAELTDV